MPMKVYAHSVAQVQTTKFFTPETVQMLQNRITAINGTPITGFQDVTDGTHAADDDNPKWPDRNTYLQGSKGNNQVKPGDEVEYTIYFLSNGDGDPTNVTVCDLVPAEMNFSPNGYGASTGIAMGLNATTLPTTPNYILTNLVDSDRGQFYQAGTQPPTTCRNPNNLNMSISTADNTSGVVAVDVVQSPDTLLHATSAGVPPKSYGFIRFKAKVK
jgi:uncharacterized repeat protein (TIGR01451 family)